MQGFSTVFAFSQAEFKKAVFQYFMVFNSVKSVLSQGQIFVSASHNERACFV